MKIKIILSSILLLVSSSLFAASWESASVEIEKTIQQMLLKVKPYKGKVDVDLELLYADLAQITDQKVDFKYLAKSVMGKHYRVANDTQKEDFQSIFKRTLIKTYAKTMVGFDIESFKLVKPRAPSPKPNKQIVVVKVTSTSGADYNLVNYMVLKEGSWKLVNIILDGFNLRVTFKNQFNSIAQKNNTDLSKTIEEWAVIMGK